MGYITTAYGVDIDQLIAVKGSNDQTIQDELAPRIKEAEGRDPFQSEDEPLTLMGALEQIIAGKIEPVPNGEHQYVYVMELLCQHMGEELDGQGHIRYMDDLDWEVAMDEFRTPFDLPYPGGFPNAFYLTTTEVAAEYKRFADEDTDDDDSEVVDAREEYVWWLKQCVDKGLGMVAFCY